MKDYDSARGVPALSILVGAHNRADKLRELLASLVACDVPVGVEWEALIADNASTDNTEAVVIEFVQRFPGRFRYLFQTNRGRSVGANLALKHARGVLIAYADDDVRVAPSWIAEIVAAYRDDAGLAGLGGRVELLDPSANTTATRRSTVPATISAETVDLTCAPVMGCNMSFRRDVLARCGALDERLGSGSVVGSAEDLDLVYRVLASGGKLKYLPQVLVFHDHGRHGEAELARSRLTYMRGRGAFYVKHLTDRLILRSLGRELRACLVAVIGELAHGRIDRPSLRELGAMAGGAVAFLRVRREPRVNTPTSVRMFPEPER